MDTHAAAGEHRLGACIADPGGWGTAPNLRRFAITLAVSTNDAAALGVAGQVAFDWMQAGVDGSPRLRWSSVQRGDWVHRVKEFRGYVRAVQPFTVEARWSPLHSRVGARGRRMTRLQPAPQRCSMR